MPVVAHGAADTNSPSMVVVARLAHGVAGGGRVVAATIDMPQGMGRAAGNLMADGVTQKMMCVAPAVMAMIRMMAMVSHAVVMLVTGPGGIVERQADGDRAGGYGNDPDEIGHL